MKVLGLSALSDIVIGIVLVFVGRDQESQALTIAGAVLAAAGLGIATWAAVQREKPIQL